MNKRMKGRLSLPAKIPAKLLDPHERSWSHFLYSGFSKSPDVPSPLNWGSMASGPGPGGPGPGRTELCSVPVRVRFPEGRKPQSRWVSASKGDPSLSCFPIKSLDFTHYHHRKGQIKMAFAHAPEKAELIWLLEFWFLSVSHWKMTSFQNLWWGIPSVCAYVSGPQVCYVKIGQIRFPYMAVAERGRNNTLKWPNGVEPPPPQALSRNISVYFFFFFF